LPDYGFLPEPGVGPVLAVEIKPKLGFLFPRNMVHPTMCNYCLKQYYKLNTGQVKFPSMYCPLDLYSGDPGRMLNALTALMASPQNNLRIFKDGDLLHGDESVHNPVCDQFLQSMFGSETIFQQVVVEALLIDPSSSTSPNTANTISMSSAAPSYKQEKSQVRRCNKSSHQLQPQSILSSVLGLQKRNHLSDCEAQIILNSLLSEGYDLAYLQSLVTSNLTSMETEQMTKAQLEKIKMLKDYLLSVTAKDLSIILTLVEDSLCAGARSGQWIRVKDKLFRFKWSIVDLDPKNLNRISKYVEQKKMWLEAFEDQK